MCPSMAPNQTGEMYQAQCHKIHASVFDRQECIPIFQNKIEFCGITNTTKIKIILD